MAPRSVVLYLKLFAASCCQMGIQFSFSAIFGLSGPLFGTQFQMNGTGVNVIFMVVGPLIGLFVQPIFGAIGDKCTFKFGRRRIFLVVGAIIDILGLCIIAASTFIDQGMNDGSEETTFSDHLVGTFLALFGLFVAFFGVNIMQAPSRAIVSDIFDAENQQDANLMINACSGFASIACYGISAGTVGSSSTFLIMFALCAIVVLVSTIPTVLFSKEERYIPEEGKKLNIFAPFIDLFHAIKMIRLDIIFILLALMFGWFAFQPFNTNFTNYMSKSVYPDGSSDDGLRMGLIILCVFAVFQCLSVFIFPIISGIIGEVTTFLLFQFLAGISYSMLCALYYTFPSNYQDDNSKPQFISSLTLGFLSSIFPAMAFVQTNSLPYSMLKKVVPEDRFGAFIGLANCAVVFAQFLSSGLIALLQLAWDDYLLPIIVSAVSSFLAAGISVVLYCVKTSEEKDVLLKQAN
ncbi:transporter, major facilitator family protein [Entamoeba histolytica HM-1:IMSS-B]|uniref:Transporter, major facilitator family n=6 Tax=Entamoeba histolytica TaxID=5759 RepID=C4LSD6_ENTH1|nr:transporter, major facilitator family [Entamoeba histolytica HM-1:IMSS]EMD42903.1 transporter major facilitator family protein, putative [Entamoeba histolytica KU27]EMH73232.1 transporter, major facilitator family protein [Entamoeba histolytica HM-1:IMSS-B]EMS17099.1 transporter, major facilitator family protein [Entamoeba histolytica HM-3:IMSS]ENY61289.1 transporter, major facilitator family protein, putative [Entamoeba histolytica HM-1:IMSS-A]BAN39410.1 transporter, major facilitator fami|eukprot:XP_656371.1 transporter, major facilitator family [Entamoeba histolytica HM-1:IMSS]